MRNESSTHYPPLFHFTHKPRMGQAASKATKRVGKSAESLVKKASEHKVTPPPPPLPTPPSQNLQETSTPANPGGFLRGDGVATQDIRDVGQEIFLKSQQKNAPKEMPPDLLQFIQDVGPAKQSVDKDMTSSRLLELENVKELERMESQRKAPRKRIDMPLMGEDYDHSVTRNTNFSSSSSSRTEEVEKDFGVSSLQFFELVRQRRDSDNDDTTTMDQNELVDKFYDKVKGDDICWSEEESQNHKKILKDALKAVHIPVLRVDREGNILGLHPDRVPGAEVRSLQPIPSSKVRLVLEDVIERANEPPITIKRIRPQNK